jgi:hypothetical protein
MPRFLIYEDVRETRKYVVEAVDYDDAIDEWEVAQEGGDSWSFVAASTISFEVQQLDDAGNVIETFPAVQVE